MFLCYRVGEGFPGDVVPCCLIRVLRLGPVKLLEFIACTSMTLKRSRRKPDLFSVLLVVLALGMSVTLAYQINVYYGANAVPIAKQTPAGPRSGG